jgi:apolipoprotein N-acyltransferase
MIQGNITGLQKQDKDYFSININRYNDLTRQAKAEYNPDFIIWPESVFTRAYDGSPESLRNFIRDNYPPLILGIVEWKDEITNSAILVENRTEKDQYDKQRLLMFGEYIPFEKTLPILKKFTILHRSEKPGDKCVSFNIGKVRAGLSICFEDIFPDLQRENVLNNSNILVNMTNDSWYGKGLGPLHHSVLARLRGIENRRSLYRCTSTGLTTASDLTGRVTASGKMAVDEIVYAELPLYDKITLYTRIGELLSYFCIFIIFACFILYFFKKNK